MTVSREYLHRAANVIVYRFLDFKDCRGVSCYTTHTLTSVVSDLIYRSCTWKRFEVSSLASVCLGDLHGALAAAVIGQYTCGDAQHAPRHRDDGKLIARADRRQSAVMIITGCTTDVRSV